MHFLERLRKIAITVSAAAIGIVNVAMQRHGSVVELKPARPVPRPIAEADIDGSARGGSAAPCPRLTPASSLVRCGTMEKSEPLSRLRSLEGLSSVTEVSCYTPNRHL